MATAAEQLTTLSGKVDDLLRTFGPPWSSLRLPGEPEPGRSGRDGHPCGEDRRVRRGDR